jgi:hypothetical protein
MNSLILLLIIEVAIVVIPSFICFKSRHEFAKCLYSFLFVESFSRWQHAYHKHIKRSVKFTMYFIVVLFASALNIIFRDVTTDLEMFDNSILSAFKLANGYSNFFFFTFLFI